MEHHCSRLHLQLLPGFSLCLFLLFLAQPAVPLGSLPPGTLKLDLTHLDFGSLTNATQVQKMQLAVERSRRRLSYFQKLVSAKVSESVTSSPGEFETQVSAVPEAGAFITTITIGTPGVSVTAIVDTGSDLVWLQCYSQTSDPIFDPSKSSSYKYALCSDRFCNDLQPSSSCGPNSICQYTYAYGTGSSFTKGDFSYDTLTLQDTSGSNVPIPNFGFGCGYDTEGSNFASAGGLIGLGQNRVSLPVQLSSHTFSYCLKSISNSASQTSPLFLGSAASFDGYPILLSTPFVSNPAYANHYYIGLKGISVGGTPLNINPGTFDINPVNGAGGIIIDSGTTFTFLDEAAYGPLLQAFESATSLTKADGSVVGLDLCYELPSGEGSTEVPALTFHFEGGDLDLPKENYFIVTDNLLCLAIRNSQGLPFSIFGNIHQQNYHILYDLENQRLSIADTTSCDQL